MMKPTYVIAIAAIILAASFAGVAMLGDDADAEGETGTIVYQYDNQSYSDVVPAGTATLKNFNDIFPNADGTYFLGWGIVEDGNVTSTVVAGSNQTIAASGTLTLKAMFITYTISFADSEGTALENVKAVSATPGKTITLPEFVDNATAITPEGKQFAGWKIDGVIYAAGSEYTVTKAVTATPEFNDGYTVTLVADGISIVEKSLNGSLDKVYVPEKVGHTFIGWYDAEGKMYFDAVGAICKDDEGNPLRIAANITLTAKFAPDQLTVIFMAGEEKVGETTALYGATIMEPALPEGYGAWDFDFTQPITENMTIEAIVAEPEPEPEPDESIYATFNIEGEIYGPYKVTDRFSIPQTAREGYNFLGWTVQGGDGTKLTSAQVQNYEYTEDVTFVAVYEIAEPPAPEEPAFYETTTGQVAIVFIVFIVLLFGYGVYSNAFGLKDKLFGYKITKKSKEDKKE